MAQGTDKRNDPSQGEDASIDRPRLTPQGRTDPDAAGEDATDPAGSGAKQGQGDKAEG
ncbi:MAG TPA: hypothetical protein VF744_07015 [Beijerinckiaceae bacterium]|jgi:hypothetical protein